MRIPGVDWSATLLNRRALGRVRVPASEHQVEKDWGRHLMLTSGLHTLACSFADTHCRAVRNQREMNRKCPPPQISRPSPSDSLPLAGSILLRSYTPFVGSLSHKQLSPDSHTFSYLFFDVVVEDHLCESCFSTLTHWCVRLSWLQ